MAVDFLLYKYQDGIVYKDIKYDNKRYAFGLRHVQAVYMCACIAVLFLVRTNISISVMLMTDATRRNDTYDDVKIFNWNNKIQATIFSSFYFGYSLLMVPAEMCIKKFNPKYVVFFVVLANGLLTVSLPIVADKGNWIAISNAILLMGMTQSCAIPALQSLVSIWLPPQERGSLGAFVYAGAHIGTIISLPLTSTLANTALRWNMIYYMHAAAVFSMAVIWCTLTGVSPARDQVVGDNEKEYIQNSIRYTKVIYKNPWKKVLKTKPFWALTSAHVGYQIVYILFLFGLPKYYHSLINISLADVGWWSALPFVMMWIITLGIFPTSDGIYQKTVLSYLCSVSYYRKLLNSTGTFGVTLGLTILSALTSENKVLALSIATVTLGATAFQFSGFLENHSDIVPHHSGTIIFMTSFVANSVSSFVPLLLGLILDLDLSDEAKWRIIFLTAATLCVICNVFYITYGSSEKLTSKRYAGNRNEREENNLVLREMTQTNRAYDDDLLT